MYIASFRNRILNFQLISGEAISATLMENIFEKKKLFRKYVKTKKNV